ncbi:transaldolase [Moniliophthora roreri]|nr:transaldolase [Moniliophthora roreri]
MLMIPRLIPSLSLGRNRRSNHLTTYISQSCFEHLGSKDTLLACGELPPYIQSPSPSTSARANTYADAHVRPRHTAFLEQLYDTFSSVNHNLRIQEKPCIQECEIRLPLAGTEAMVLGEKIAVAGGSMADMAVDAPVKETKEGSGHLVDTPSKSNVSRITHSRGTTNFFFGTGFVSLSTSSSSDISSTSTTFSPFFVVFPIFTAFASFFNGTGGALGIELSPLPLQPWMFGGFGSITVPERGLVRGSGFIGRVCRAPVVVWARSLSSVA